MRKLPLWIVAALLLVIAGLWFLAREEAPAQAAAPNGASRAEAAPTGPPARAAAAPGMDEVRAAPPKPRRDRSERERMRQRILAAMIARGDAVADAKDDDDDDDDGSDRARRRRGASAPADAAPSGPGLTDRSGNHGYLLKVMNEALMPLADECYTNARATNPALAGMLVLDLELLSDAEIGGVVDSIEPGAANELVDADLLECVRESILATTLPAPPEGGRDALSLSLRLTPEDE